VMAPWSPRQPLPRYELSPSFLMHRPGYTAAWLPAGSTFAILASGDAQFIRKMRVELPRDSYAVALEGLEGMPGSADRIEASANRRSKLTVVPRSRLGDFTRRMQIQNDSGGEIPFPKRRIAHSDLAVFDGFRVDVLIRFVPTP
jgi:hypothetical protein